MKWRRHAALKTSFFAGSRGQSSFCSSFTGGRWSEAFVVASSSPYAHSDKVLRNAEVVPSAFPAPSTAASNVLLPINIILSRILPALTFSASASRFHQRPFVWISRSRAFCSTVAHFISENTRETLSLDFFVVKICNWRIAGLTEPYCYYLSPNFIDDSVVVLAESMGEQPLPQWDYSQA